MAKGVIDLFMIYQFLKRLVTPFEKWEAYETGVIDENGRVIVRKNDRTPEQSKSWGYYDRLVANLKKLLAKVPGGRTRIASFAAALLLIREENIDPDDLETLSERLQHYMEEAKYLSEEMAINVAGSGAIAGIGVGDDGEPGVPPAAHKKHKKKNKEQEKEVGRKVTAMKSFKQFSESVELEPQTLNENALKALRYAAKAHSGQKRRSGAPYIQHPIEVARFVKQFKSSNNLDALIQAAYLHDTVEDTDTTHEDLVKQFGGLVADMVKQLTSDKEAIDALGKGEYIAQKMAKMSSWALIVKLADRLANVQDIDSQPSEFQKRYAAQTKLAFDRLRKDRYLSKTHNKIMSAIEDKIKEYYE